MLLAAAGAAAATVGAADAGGAQQKETRLHQGPHTQEEVPTLSHPKPHAETSASPFQV